MKKEIRSINGFLLYEFECKECDSDKIFQNADLCNANLRNANLRGADLCNANLRNADLRGADLRNADLCNADLRGADLRNADLCNADLCGADLRGADLRGADLRNADLCGADLRGADLRNADLCGADLRGADLRGADLRNADLRGTKNIPYIPMNIPEGEFIAWKILPNKVIVKLKILEDSKRSRATGNKCRCDKALVLEMQNKDGSKADITEYTSNKYAACTYKVGEIVESDSWDENRYNECSHGIHFFLDRQSAVNFKI